MAIDTKISTLIRNQVPEFIRRDHPNIIEFLEAYYEWLEMDRNAEDSIKNLLNYQDVDTTLDDFLTFFRREFLATIPENCLADKRLLVKHIKQFYRAKGTEKSYKLLFNILFGTDVNFDFPGRRMLRTSDGKWRQNKTLRVRQIIGKGNPVDFTTKRIVGNNSLASAVVEKVQIKQFGINTVHELFLNLSSIDGQFQVGEIVTVDGIEAQIFGTIAGVDIINPGQGYAIGDEITFGSPGTGAKGVVSAIDTTAGDQITAIQITEFGAGYDLNNPPPAIFPPATITAQGDVIIEALTTSAGSFLNEDGFISDNRFLQDSFFYQQFSYVLLAEQSIEEYRRIVQDTIHPSGLVFFGKVSIVNVFDAEVQPALGEGRCAQICRVMNFCSDAVDASATFPEEHSFTPITLDIILQEGPGSRMLGMTYEDLEHSKFFYLPSTHRPNVDTEDFPAPTTNGGYWDQYANTQIKDFANIKLGDVILTPGKQINIQPDPDLKNEITP